MVVVVVMGGGGGGGGVQRLNIDKFIISKILSADFKSLTRLASRANFFCVEWKKSGPGYEARLLCGTVTYCLIIHK